MAARANRLSQQPAVRYASSSRSLLLAKRKEEEERREAERRQAAEQRAAQRKEERRRAQAERQAARAAEAAQRRAAAAEARLRAAESGVSAVAEPGETKEQRKARLKALRVARKAKRMAEQAALAVGGTVELRDEWVQCSMCTKWRRVSTYGFLFCFYSLCLFHSYCDRAGLKRVRNWRNNRKTPIGIVDAIFGMTLTRVRFRKRTTTRCSPTFVPRKSDSGASR